MKLFLISQGINNDYDTYDSAVVAAIDANDAKLIHPYNNNNILEYEYSADAWVNDPKYVIAEYLGEARKGMSRGVICSSFNPG